MLDTARGDVLIRVHTAIHNKDEAVDLAKFISELVPGAHIFGTSTSAVIHNGKLIQNQCVVSVTQMTKGYVRTALLPAYDDDNAPIPPAELCKRVKNAVITDDTKLMLTFLTGKYLDVYDFLQHCNEQFPGVEMIGGFANTSEINLRKFASSGFLFNEHGSSEKGIILAAIGGGTVESSSSYVSGIEPVGGELTITDTFGRCLLALDGKDGAEQFRLNIGDELREDPEIANLFPFIYSDSVDEPFLIRYNGGTSFDKKFDPALPENKKAYDEHPGIDTAAVREMVFANHNLRPGRKIRRAFIYDRKIIAENRRLFRQAENFEKAETVFAYSCFARAVIYSNCVRWELSAYENSNICGCVTEGEIVCTEGRNTFANCSFAVSVIGENKSSQIFNPFVFNHTDSLAADNNEMLSYLYETEARHSKGGCGEQRMAFARECENKLLYSDKEEMPNTAAMNLDIGLKGYDRVCMINVPDTSSMGLVFSDKMIELTYQNYISKCLFHAKTKGYRIYHIKDWHIAIAAPSYTVALPDFIEEMTELQKTLFRANAKYIAIVPLFCVIDDCTVDNVFPSYYSARVEMMQKNVQFYVVNANVGQLDEESLRERYHMVNVINYAIDNDKVIPYFQGIYDNNRKSIHHYESLMRLQDKNGRIYYPNSFLDVARQYGLLYDTLSKMMIKKVFRKFDGVADKSVSLNIGMRDIKNPEITQIIYNFLSATEYPQNFIFEILENEDIDDYEELVFFVDKIHEYGGLISIDDFGSGYSNLQHIASINFDYLKLDGSIVRQCTSDDKYINLVALIANWKNLSTQNIKLVAEFVENQEIQDLLIEFKIDYSQGYLFSKPAPEIKEQESGKGGC